MTHDRLTALVQVLVFYLMVLVLLLGVGGQLQVGLGLPGVIVGHLLIFGGLPLLFALYIDQKPVAALLRLRMLSARGVLKAVALGLSSWFMVTAMGALVSLLVERLGGELLNPYALFFTGPAWLTLVAGALVPAICEELSFRGYVQGVLRPLGPMAAVLITGILFGALHLSIIRLIPLSLLGILWSLAAQRSGSALPGMIAHLINNGVSLVLTLLLDGWVAPAQAETLDAALPSELVAFLIAAALAAGLLAYGIAAGFGPRDLLRPDAAAAEEEALRRAGGAERFALAVPAGSPELAAMQQELEELRARRGRLIKGAGILTGLPILAIYLWAAVQEILRTFPQA